MEDRQGKGRFPYSPWTDESNWGETLCETDDLLDQLVASKKALGRGGGDSPGEMLRKCKIVNPTVFEMADLV